MVYCKSFVKRLYVIGCHRVILNEQVCLSVEAVTYHRMICGVTRFYSIWHAIGTQPFQIWHTTLDNTSGRAGKSAYHSRIFLDTLKRPSVCLPRSIVILSTALYFIRFGFGGAREEVKTRSSRATGNTRIATPKVVSSSRVASSKERTTQRDQKARIGT